jgi:hypothetical protein
LREIEQFQERGLARARWAGKEVEATLRQAEIEVAQDLAAGAVAQADTVEFGNRRQNFILPAPAIAAVPRCLAIWRAFLFTL